MTVILVILYFVVGFLVALYLYATWEGHTLKRQEKIDLVAPSLIFCPELWILALAFWPLYLMVRIGRLVLKWTSSKG